MTTQHFEATPELQQRDPAVPWVRLVAVSLALQGIWFALLAGGWQMSNTVANGDGQWFFLLILGVPLLLMELAIGPMLVFAIVGAAIAGLAE